jgi:hypothetical protein
MRDLLYRRSRLYAESTMSHSIGTPVERYHPNMMYHPVAFSDDRPPARHQLGLSSFGYYFKDIDKFMGMTKNLHPPDSKQVRFTPRFVKLSLNTPGYSGCKDSLIT